MKIATALFVLLCGTLLAAYGGVPDDYWQSPSATKGNAPHDWSALEKNPHPEACAQCHGEQFEDWKQSLHAKAFSPGLLGQFPDMTRGDVNDCLNCHAPLSEQKFGSNSSITASLTSALKHPAGFNSDADLEKVSLPLRHAGVTCAACHLRGYRRFGPPRRGGGDTGLISAPAHGGFTASRSFEKSQFCSSCHQFPQSYAINGKPMENTITEWRQSRFASIGVECQSCHMPERRHEFRGIHDPAMVGKGLTIDAETGGDRASLTIASTWIGHAFPTYVTPKVVVAIEALASDGSVLLSERWEIGRVVEYDDGWKELSDTRLMPGEKRKFELNHLPARSRSIRFAIDVVPDAFYKNTYRALLDGDLQAHAEKLIRRAKSAASNNDYRLYEHEEKL